MITKIEEGKKTLRELVEMIEKDPSIYKEKKVTMILHATSLLCGILAAQPFPFADIFVLTPIQLIMVTALNKIKGNPYQKAEIKEILVSLLGVIGWGTLAQHTILGLYKSVIPFLGAVTTVPLVYGATFALGKAAETVIEAKTNDQTLSKTDLQKLVKETKEKAKAEHPTMTFQEALQELGKLKQTSQEYKEYRTYIEQQSFLQNDKTIIECLRERMQRKYSHVHITEIALSILAFFPHEIILGEIEPIIAQLQFDLSKVSNARKKRYPDGEGIEILGNFGSMQVQIKERERYITTIEPAKQYEHIWEVLSYTENQEEQLYDKEIRDRFYQMLSSAQQEIFIISPWVSWKVTKQVLPLLKKATLRGVHISIIYGIGDNKDDKRNQTSEEQIRYYQKELGKALTVKKDNTHVKICICDHSYLVGSYNFLSFDGEYATDTRHELCSYGVNIPKIQAWKQMYF